MGFISSRRWVRSFWNSCNSYKRTFLNIYAAPNISRGSRKVLKIAYETIAYSAETLVFIFLGIGVFAFQHPTEEVKIGSIAFAIINLNLARFANISLVSWLANKTRS